MVKSNVIIIELFIVKNSQQWCGLVEQPPRSPEDSKVFFRAVWSAVPVVFGSRVTFDKRRDRFGDRTSLRICLD